MSYAKSICIGVGAFLTVGIVSLPVYAEGAAKEYVGTKECKMCHSTPAKGDQYKKWSDSKHAHALESLSSDRALEIAKEKKLANPPNQEPACLKCHVTGYDETTKAAPAKIDMKLGVQCESCHGLASAHLPDGKALMMKKPGIDPTLNLVNPTAEVCVKCHNSESPSWDPEKYTTADGKKTGFDFEQAHAATAHPNPQKPKAK